MSNKKEYAIGEEVQMGLVTLVCVERVADYDANDYYHCDGCYMRSMCSQVSSGAFVDSILGDCSHTNRTDNKDVVFKLKTK